MKTLKNITIFLLLFNIMILLFWFIILTGGGCYSITIDEYIKVIKEFYQAIL